MGINTNNMESFDRVISRMRKAMEESDDDYEMFNDAMDDMLDRLHCEDAFGTEGQCDPRGDFRNGVFTMTESEE